MKKKTNSYNVEAEYGKKFSDSKGIEMKIVKYKAAVNEPSITIESGSTVPLMESTTIERDVELEEYDPFMHREVDRPTTNCETFIHLLKGSLGSGILAMPRAIMNAGILFGPLLTIAIGAICTYCIHVLVKTSRELCRKRRVPALSYAETAEAAFLSGPNSFHKYSRLAKATINLFLVLDLLGCCCVYVLFVAKNIKQVIDFYTSSYIDLRYYMVMLWPFLIMINLIKDLKRLSPLSMAANLLIALGMGITYYYMCLDLPSPTERPLFSTVRQLPSFFGTVIFALEGIGVVMPLENHMKNPKSFLGWPGVLNFGMTLVVFMYATTGLLGYWHYGDDTQDSITLNLPKDDMLAQSVQVMIAIAIFLTYSLQFYVPMEIIWNNIKHRFDEKKVMAEYSLRIFLVTLTVVLSIVLPNLGPFITLIGAVCLSTLGLIFPAVIEVVTFLDNPDYTKSIWFWLKNGFLIVFGLVGFVTGTQVSIQEFSHG